MDDVEEIVAPPHSTATSNLHLSGDVGVDKDALTLEDDYPIEKDKLNLMSDDGKDQFSSQLNESEVNDKCKSTNDDEDYVDKTIYSELTGVEVDHVKVSQQIEPKAVVDSILQEERRGSRIIVEFLVLPDSRTIEQEFHVDQRISELRDAISATLNVPPDAVSLQIRGSDLQSDAHLVDYCSEQDGFVCINVFIELDGSAALKRADQFPEGIQVNIEFGDGTPAKSVFLKIINEAQSKRKAYLGGFRHTITRLVYHHAQEQTTDLRAAKIAANAHQLNHRETQTHKLASRHVQTKREAGTQMSKRGLVMSEKEDRIVIPRTYVTSEQVNAEWNVHAIKIQCFIRSIHARRRARELYRQRQEKEYALLRRQQEETHRLEELQQKEINRRVQPKSFNDFAILKRELEEWRIQETKRIHQSAGNEDERHLQLQRILKEETKLLQAIDRLRISAGQQGKDMRILEKLSMMAAPKRMILSSARVEIETPATNRANQLARLYTGLRLENISLDERLDILLHVKWTVKEFDCTLSRDIVELIDREADMLNRGRTTTSLTGLRQRLSNLFYHFVNTPEFNEESAKFQPVKV